MRIEGSLAELGKNPELRYHYWARPSGGLPPVAATEESLAEFLHHKRSDPARALTLLEEGLQLMESAAEPVGQAVVLLALAKLHAKEGDADKAEARARQCLEIARQHDVTFVIEQAESILESGSATQ